MGLFLVDIEFSDEEASKIFNDSLVEIIFLLAYILLTLYDSCRRSPGMNLPCMGNGFKT